MNVCDLCHVTLIQKNLAQSQGNGHSCYSMDECERCHLETTVHPVFGAQLDTPSGAQESGE